MPPYGKQYGKTYLDGPFHRNSYRSDSDTIINEQAAAEPKRSSDKNNDAKNETAIITFRGLLGETGERFQK